MKISKIKSVTYRSSDNNGEPIPCIIIQGKFLKQYGFKVGAKAKIEYSKNNITLMLTKDKIVKPKCWIDRNEKENLIIIGIISKELRKNGLYYQSSEFVKKALRIKSYKDVLKLSKKYIEIIYINKKTI